MHLGELAAGPLTLRRARADDLDALMALQRTAYARNRMLLGVEPLPLLADYVAILRDKEVWVGDSGDGRFTAALILQPCGDHLLLWSIATDPAVQGGGLGRALLGATEERARQLGFAAVRLYTGTLLRHLVDWYDRHGYVVERIEALSDRSITHMIKHLATRTGR
jgi:ribosomal protein S18 acetylase RimI-like enzyme